MDVPGVERSPATLAPFGKSRSPRLRCSRRAAIALALALLAAAGTLRAGHVGGRHVDVTLTLATGTAAVGPSAPATRISPAATNVVRSGAVQVAIQNHDVKAVDARAGRELWRARGANPEGGLLLVGASVFWVEPAGATPDGSRYALVERVVATGAERRRITVEVRGAPGELHDSSLELRAPGVLVWGINILHYG